MRIVNVILYSSDTFCALENSSTECIYWSTLFDQQNCPATVSSKVPHNKFNFGMETNEYRFDG